MCVKKESDTTNFASSSKAFFEECFLLNERIELTRNRYLSTLNFLNYVFENMNEVDYFSTSEKKKYVEELISDVKECQSCISRLSTKVQSLNKLTDQDFKLPDC